MTAKYNILIIGTVWPEPDSSAAGTRMLQLIKSFQKEGYRVHFATSCAPSEFMFDLAKMEVEKHAIELNNQSFDSFVKSLNPGIVMFDRFMTEEQYGWRVAENCPDALRILDTEDLHCLRYARQEAFRLKEDYNNFLSSDIAKREIASILRSDLSLIISEFEMDLLVNHFKIVPELLLYLPFMLDPLKEENIDTRKTFSERKDFISIGNFLHEPNWNAVQFLKQEIWPLIRKKLPDANMFIYGAYPPQKALQLNNASALGGFNVLGRAENSKLVMSNARICLAPLRIGAGLKGKLIEAMQCGTPSVTTSIGAEGMNGNLEWCGVIADNAVEFADAAVALYTNESLWNTAQQKGINIHNERFDRNRHENRLIEVVNQLLKALQGHRKNNFFGSMLMHHTMAATKYMSKWIEEKNK